jgi:cation diffusion facilitator CzcD-associated flavoprotein CzcO
MPEPAQRDVIVVGAGAAGLAVAGELKRRGVTPLLVERSEVVGSSWRGRYRDLELNNDRWTARLPRSPIPRGAGRWPARDEYISYLERYVERHGLDIRFGVQVRRIDDDRCGWRVETGEQSLPARYVVVCTGTDRLAELPAWPGREGFEGRLLHAAEYRAPQQFDGEDVLVVGLGTSATEIAVRLVGSAARVRVAVRGTPNLMPAGFLGLPMPVWARVFQGAPRPLVDSLGRLVQRLGVRGLGDLGLEPAPHGVATELAIRGMGPVIDRGFLSAVRAGAVELVGAVEGFEGPEVRLADGDRFSPDAVIAATGYRPGLDEVVGHLAVLDPSGRPLKHGAEDSADAAGLFFNGYRLPLSGELSGIRVDSRRIAKRIAGELRAN